MFKFLEKIRDKGVWYSLILKALDLRHPDNPEKRLYSSEVNAFFIIAKALMYLSGNEVNGFKAEIAEIIKHVDKWGMGEYNKKIILDFLKSTEKIQIPDAFATGGCAGTWSDKDSIRYTIALIEIANADGEYNSKERLLIENIMRFVAQIHAA